MPPGRGMQEEEEEDHLHRPCSPQHLQARTITKGMKRVSEEVDTDGPRPTHPGGEASVMRIGRPRCNHPLQAEGE